MDMYKEKLNLIFVVPLLVTAFLYFEWAQNQYAMSFIPSQSTEQNVSSQSLPATPAPNSVEAFPANPTAKNDSSGELIYENTSAGVKLIYPSDWMNSGSYHDKFLNLIASFHGTVDKHGLPVIQILSKASHGAKTVEEYANTVFKNEGKNVKGYEIVELETEGITINGKPAYKAVVIYNTCVVQYCSGEEKRGKMLELGTISEKGEVIAIIYDAYESDYPRYLPIAQKMIDSLEVR